ITPRPILIIHGLKDSVVNPKDALLLYAAAKEPKELWLLPDVEHCGAYFADRIAYTQKVIDFFDLHLRKSQLSNNGKCAGIEGTVNLLDGVRGTPETEIV
ncbi:MAG: alpha/beta hydrolase, partial [Chloroflexi bacterium]|nr:alpha/beta hydrolase [Chloroflexota bacterium]